MMMLMIPISMVLWMVGGQINKAVRRYGIPSVALGFGLWRLLRTKERDEDWGKVFLLLLCIPVLCMGYGVDSGIKRLVETEWKIRLVYGFLLSVPVGVAAAVMGRWVAVPIITWLYVVAFQVEAKSLGRVGKYDVLIEDMIRGAVFGLGIIYAIG